nr:hypothetical protein GCM10020093_016180 [Planobispora longispora]
MILPLAGFTASQSEGKMSLFDAVLWTTLGSVVGALVLYGVGALLGRERVIFIASKLPLINVSDIEKTEAWFARHGKKTVFFGRMIPIFRSLISIPAGVERMPLSIFTILTLAGSLIWNTAFIMAGYALGEQYHLIEQYMGIVSKAVLGVVLLAVVIFIWVRLVDRRKGKHHAG